MPYCVLETLSARLRCDLYLFSECRANYACYDILTAFERCEPEHDPSRHPLCSQVLVFRLTADPAGYQ